MDNTIPQNLPQDQYSSLERVHLPLQELRDRYLNGESENALAKAFTVGRASIRIRLQKMGIAIRGQKEANQLLIASRTPEERKKYTEAAHNVMRGRTVPFDEQCRNAKGRQDKQAGISPSEKLLKKWLEDRGITVTSQLAIGPYNVDITFNNIAIEVYGGGWHASGRHFARAQKRFEYIRNQGWNTIIIWDDRRRYPMTEAIADFILTCVGVFSNTTGQCKVVEGNGVEFPPDSPFYKKAIGIK